VPGSEVHPTSIVSPDADVGRDVTIEPYCIVHANVVLGDGSYVASHSVVGSPTADHYADPESYEPAPCRIGRNALLRSHAVVYAGAEIGDGFSCGHRVTIREGSHIGDGVQIGTDCDLQGYLTIGSHSRLHSGIFVPYRTTIEELVWIFPHAVLLNDPHPPSDECTQGPTLRRFAVIGASSTIFPGVEVGEGALVGAMSLVRRDVPAHAVVAGVPAKELGPTSELVCHEGRVEQLYPWWTHFRRGYPDGVLPSSEASGPTRSNRGRD
jgi:acetyltransferase-like isoleucine patch superfamily enzyme